jgi:hypothetical protein
VAPFFNIPLLLVFSILLNACQGVAPRPAQVALPYSLLGDLEEWKTASFNFNAEKFRAQIRSESDFWSQYKKILFLAEGSSYWTGTLSSQHLRFAEILKDEYPAIDIWAADFEIPIVSDDRIHVLAINHRTQFPSTVTKGTFDAVIGMRILCHCKRDEHPTDNMMCGGIHANEQDLMHHFLEQVTSLLDPNNGRSFAFLEGEERYPGKYEWMDDVIHSAQRESRENWTQVIASLNRKSDHFQTTVIPTIADSSLRKAIFIRR